MNRANLATIGAIVIAGISCAAMLDSVGGPPPKPPAEPPAQRAGPTPAEPLEEVPTEPRDDPIPERSIILDVIEEAVAELGPFEDFTEAAQAADARGLALVVFGADDFPPWEPPEDVLVCYLRESPQFVGYSRPFAVVYPAGRRNSQPIELDLEDLDGSLAEALETSQ